MATQQNRQVVGTVPEQEDRKTDAPSHKDDIKKIPREMQPGWSEIGKD